MRDLGNIISHIVVLGAIGISFLLMVIIEHRSRHVFIFSFLLLSVILIIFKDIGDTSGTMGFLLFFCMGVKNKYIRLHTAWYFITPVVVVIAIVINSGIKGGSPATITKALTMFCTNAYIFLREFDIIKHINTDWYKYGLKPIEREFISTLYKGYTIKELAVHLGCSESYVKKVQAGLRQKIGVTTNAQIALWAKDNKLL